MTANDTNLLTFGIPTFDGLFKSFDPTEAYLGSKILNPDFNNCGIQISGGDTSSICIIGGDGVGKSVFALHLASRYMAGCAAKKNSPRVFYISTDLNFGKAEKMWTNFSLNQPDRDRDPFSKGSGVKGVAEIDLVHATPKNLEESLSEEQKNKVVFVNLAANTAGDDWSFLHRFISVLNKPSKKNDKHLIIIDAVEGFETYVGDLDAFGEQTSRRARIAQVMRLVNDKSHLVFIVDQSHYQKSMNAIQNNLSPMLLFVFINRRLKVTCAERLKLKRLGDSPMRVVHINIQSELAKGHQQGAR